MIDLRLVPGSRLVVLVSLTAFKSWERQLGSRCVDIGLNLSVWEAQIGALWFKAALGPLLGEGWQQNSGPRGSVEGFSG